MDTNHWQLERLWPDPDTGPFRLRLKFGQVRGRTAVTAVELRGVAPENAWPMEQGRALELPDAPIQATDIRLPLGALLDAHTMLSGAYARAARSLWPANEENIRSYEEQAGVRPGRPRTSEAFLRQVASIYTTAEQTGDRAPAKRVYEQLNANTLNTARGWIRRARKRGFLASANQDKEDSSNGSPNDG